MNAHKARQLTMHPLQRASKRNDRLFRLVQRHHFADISMEEIGRCQRWIRIIHRENQSYLNIAMLYVERARPKEPEE